MGLRDLLAAMRGRLARQEGAVSEHGGPIGREDTVWGHGPGVHVDDTEAWEWFDWDEGDPPAELEAWADGIQERMPYLPDGSLLYDLGAGLRIDELESAKDDAFRVRVREFHQATLDAFRLATKPDEWIYAIDEPEAGYGYCYRFWPHRATETTRWYVSPIPDGDDEFFVSRDFDWGLLALFGGFPHADWQVAVFGQPLIDAFAVNPPQGFSTRLQGAAFSQGDPEVRQRESNSAVLMFQLGLNCELAKHHGLWNEDLERRYRKLAKLEAESGDEGQALELLAGLIARVELALADAGVEYVPAMSHLEG